MITQRDHLIGLLLGAEEDWPTAFEQIARKLGVITGPDGTRHTVATERVTIEPFNLRDPARHDLVIDRLAYWYYHPREWLKKVALMDDVYLLNSPFTFQSMEKHSAYCALAVGDARSRHGARALQTPGRQRPLGLPGEVQPVLRLTRSPTRWGTRSS